MTRLVDFLEEKSLDNDGKSISDILAFNSEQLENSHTYIQWLFPLSEASLAVPNSPTLVPKEIDSIKRSTKAQANIALATQRMMNFYSDTEHWLTKYDHNHLRITRIIKSLRLLAGYEKADCFYQFILNRVMSSSVEINPVTLKYWKEA